MIGETSHWFNLITIKFVNLDLNLFLTILMFKFVSTNISKFNVLIKGINYWCVLQVYYTKQLISKSVKIF